jgi:ferredoxin
MTYVIAEPCIDVKEGSCVDVCPVDCIHTTPEDRQLYIDPDICIECEQCALVCPVEAVFLDTKLPPEWEPFKEINAAFFRRNKEAAMPVPIDKAIRMIQAAHGKAAEVGAHISVAVVDEGGRLIALGRMDRARPMSVDMATNKAYTAASFQLATNELAALAGQNWFQSLVVSSQGRIMAQPGAMPIVDGVNIVGAIGVAGGTDEQDQQCCKAGLANYM